MDHGPSMADGGYRLLLDRPPSAHFNDAFPQLVTRSSPDGLTVVEGPVADPSQLAGIVCDLCYRNTWILRMEWTGSEALDDAMSTMRRR